MAEGSHGLSAGDISKGAIDGTTVMISEGSECAHAGSTGAYCSMDAITGVASGSMMFDCSEGLSTYMMMVDNSKGVIAGAISEGSEGAHTGLMVADCSMGASTGMAVGKMMAEGNPGVSTGMVMGDAGMGASTGCAAAEGRQVSSPGLMVMDDGNMGESTGMATGAMAGSQMVAAEDKGASAQGLCAGELMAEGDSAAAEGNYNRRGKRGWSRCSSCEAHLYLGYSMAQWREYWSRFTPAEWVEWNAKELIADMPKKVRRKDSADK